MPGHVADPNVERQWTRMIAHVRRVMAGGAGAVDRRHPQRIVQARHPADGKRVGVEDRFAPGERFPRLSVAP